MLSVARRLAPRWPGVTVTLLDRRNIVSQETRETFGALGWKVEMVAADVFAYLRGNPVPFDVIFVAPPQWRGLWTRAVQLLDQRPGWLAPDGVIVVQHDPAESTDVPLQHVRISGERTYGRVRFTFFGPRGD